MHGLDTSNVWSRVESCRVEPSGIWAIVSEDRIALEWVIGRLESDYPDAVDLPTARADAQDGASSQHCVEIC